MGPCAWLGVGGRDSDLPGILGKEAAIFPKPVLDSVDLLDVWLGEPRNPNGFWVARMGLIDEDCWQASGYLVRS